MRMSLGGKLQIRAEMVIWGHFLWGGQLNMVCVYGHINVNKSAIAILSKRVNDWLTEVII